MARQAKPWWRKDRQGWYVTLDGKRHFLGEHPKGSPKPKKGKTGWNVPDSITDAFRAIQKKKPVSPDSVAAVLDDFLTWCYENRADRTADRYKDFCQSFIDEHPTLLIADLHTGHVTTWLNNQPTWNSTTKHNAITAIQRGLNWAVRNRGLKYNPIRGMEKPKPQRRTTVVSHDDFDELLTHVKDQPFQDLLIVSWDCGSRPQEIKRLEARQLDLANQRAVITAEDGAKGGITRAIYFPTKRSMQIIRRLVKEHPEGELFRNVRGTPWTGFAIKNRFERLEKKTGKRFHHYALRHSNITNSLRAGVDSHVVAHLAGHTSTKMIDEVYSHVAQDPAFMLNQAKKGASASAKKPASQKNGSHNGKKKGTQRGRSQKS